MDWHAFVVAYGWRARGDHLAHVLGQPVEAIDRLRRADVSTRLPRPLGFADLFAKWQGRPPADEDWPAPRRIHGSYEWLQPELALLARLVGTISVRELAATLTERLRRLTQDPSAERGRLAVQVRINRIGLQAGDVVGGLTTRAAAQRVGRVSLVNQAIHNKQLRTFRVGKRHVIPREEFERWLAGRDEEPQGWVRLASLRAPLGMNSDKLPEYATLGYIPDARLVKGIGTARGMWFLPRERAQQILADAKAGRPMPWNGKPLPGNQRATWKKWRARQHRRCARCSAIWHRHAPRTFDAFCRRYESLSLGDKRHLTLDRSKPISTRTWRARGSVVGRMRAAGVTVYEAAAMLQQPSRWIRGWIRRGLFRWGGLARDPLGGEALRITPLGLCMLQAVAAAEEAEAAADRRREWLGVYVAAQLTSVCVATVYSWRAVGAVVTKPGPRGLLFERSSLEHQARRYWEWAMRRYWRAAPPAWVSEAA